MISNRQNDWEIKRYVNEDATVPTIYEFIVAIAWYYISDKKISVYDSLNLTLNGDLEPVIHAGGGILLAQASAELAALAEFLDIPISRTLMGQGCVSDLHPLMVGQTGFWGIAHTHAFTLNADIILALGTRFAEADSSSWYQGVTFDPTKTKFLQIDIDPTEIGRNYPVEIGAVADLKLALAQILEAAKAIKPEGIKRPGLREGIAKAKAEFKESVKAITEDLRFPMTPQRILKDVKEVSRRKSPISRVVPSRENFN